MPYTVDNPPEAVKGLPKHAIEIFVAAYNSAFEQYDGDEAKSAATAWAAVKTKYKKDASGNWVAKEASMANKLSDNNKRQLLRSALVSEYGIEVESPIPKNLSIEEVFDNELIYNIDGQLYQSTYELGEDGKPTFGDPKKVLSTRTFKAMESLRAKHAEIIQELGRRNAATDAARVKKIVALCQELLSSEDAEESRVEGALKEADGVLSWLQEQAATKTEDGVQFPATAFAYVTNADTPSGWKLRLWEDLEKKVTRAQLGRAAAALSPGGFRGQKIAIPSADLASAKRKIRAEYRKLNVEDEEISRWVKETMMRDKQRFYTPLTEATFDRGRATIIVIKAGFNADKSRYYPAEMLKRDYKVFEGQKMYADHPTESEEKELPERSIKSGGWVATLKGVTCDENGTVTGVADIVEEWLMKKLATLRDKEMLSEMGISINALGNASKANIEGKATLVIEELTACRSVDFVTEPGAGGNVTLYETDRNLDVDLIEISALREKRPDLVEAIEAEVRAGISREVKKAMEDKERIVELEGQITTLTTERDGLQTKVTEAEKAMAKAEAQATIKEAVAAAELPEAAKERLVERFKDAESAEGIEVAIKAEIDYIAKLAEAGKVKGFGASTPNPEKDKAALKESFKRMHPEWTETQLETAAIGR